MSSERPVVLVVEDDVDVRQAIVSALEDEGFVVESASDGSVALQMLQGGLKPSVVLLDLMMPVMDGWELRKKMQDDVDLRAIPVVAMSAAHSMPEGDQAFLQKPVRLEALLSTINRAKRP